MNALPRATRAAQAASIACIVLSSFLLFEIEPLFAKTVLPHFGGAPRRCGLWR